MARLASTRSVDSTSSMSIKSGRVGEGALYQEFMRLKAMLEAEGLFAAERKRPIPLFPQKLGIVTSATGAALRDMLNTLRRRMPLVQVILAPSPVQGSEAPPALVKAIHSLNLQSPDVIIIARGGGSIEDLWAFNDERLVRAVALSDAPVICGVGHETDFTLCDFAADLRARLLLLRPNWPRRLLSWTLPRQSPISGRE